MNCRLCNRPIKEYEPAFHQLRIDEQHTVDICPACTDTFIKWQGNICAKLFPTKTLKKRYDKNK